MTGSSPTRSSPTRLRVEHGPRPLGIGFTRPRLSWWLPPGSPAQQAYRVEASIDGRTVEAGEVAGDEPFLQPWPLDELGSRTRVAWRVRVRTGDGWGEWSEPHGFETGLLELDDWEARFVGAPDGIDPFAPRGQRGALCFRRTFHVDRQVERARIYATAQGIYELHVDGVRVGDLELTPGFTAYRSHLEVQTYDAGALLTPGEHTLVATVTDGWWRGSVGFTREECSYGKSLALLVQIETVDRAGHRQVVATDESWDVTAAGPIVAADLIEGERVDQRVPFPPGDGWTAVDVVAPVDARLAISPAPPTRRVQEYRPSSVTRLDERRQVVDLGGNINGWVRIAGRVLGDAGNVVRLRHGERLGEDGDVDVRHLQAFDFVTKTPFGAGQVDEVVSSGPDAPDFEPRHTTHGFQFVGVDGARDLTTNDATGVLVQTDLVRTGWFRCSDERVNALHEATVLSFRDNACEIPTDCPQRERAGWTGDWQLFVPTASFLYDVAGFSTRWLRDLAADQWDDGRVPNFVPEPLPPAARTHAIASYLTGSAGWGDAAILVPFQLWQSYGDADVLARQYPSMERWVEFALRRAAEHRHPSRAAARPEPAPHEGYLWDIGFHWGEWCEPDTDVGPVMTGEQDVGEVATAYLFRSLSTLARIAGILGKDDDATRYTDLARNVRAAWQAEYVSADGEVTPAKQANLVRALAFSLVEDEQRARVAGDLVALIRDAGTHVGTGFLATPFLLPVLADSGHLDVAYELLLQTTPPSWLAMIDAGATTVWENWEGVDETGMGSLNHYSKGAVISFLHEYVAGLRPIRGVPAYRRFEIRPAPGGGITSADAHLDTPYGTIGSSWRVERGSFALDVEIAPGTEATVTLPDGATHVAGPGCHHYDAQVHR